MRTHQAAKRPAPVVRAEDKSAERALSSHRSKQGNAAVADRQTLPPVHQFASLSLERPSVAAAPPPNRTGLPDRLKAGIEHLSGFAMDDVQVHYNSSKPATVQALAYTKGTEIHISPGQEQHLPHEAWHVVQQARGRVKPTLQMKGVAINDDAALEREADAMARQAAAMPRQGSVLSDLATVSDKKREVPPTTLAPATVQRQFSYKGKTYDGRGKLPTIFKVSPNDLESLAKSPTDHGDLTDMKPAQIAELAKKEGNQKPNVAEAYKKQKTATFVSEKMRIHMAGEEDAKEKTVTGGHLLSLMEEKHGQRLRYTLTGGKQDQVWECKWGLLKVNKNDAKEYEAGPKDSTMFPAEWSWDTLVKELQASDGGMGTRTLKPSGILVEKKGDTFYPLYAAAGAAAAPNGGGAAAAAKK